MPPSMQPLSGSQQPNPQDLFKPWEHSTPASELLKVSDEVFSRETPTREDASKLQVRSASPEEWEELSKSIELMNEEASKRVVREEHQEAWQKNEEERERLLTEFLQNRFGELFYKYLENKPGFIRRLRENGLKRAVTELLEDKLGDTYYRFMIQQTGNPDFQKKSKRERYAEAAEAVCEEMYGSNYLPLYSFSGQRNIVVRFYSRLLEKEFHDDPDTAEELRQKVETYAAKAAEAEAIYQQRPAATPPPIAHRLIVENTIVNPEQQSGSTDQKTAPPPALDKSEREEIQRAFLERTALRPADESPVPQLVADVEPVTIPPPPKAPVFVAEAIQSPTRMPEGTAPLARQASETDMEQSPEQAERDRIEQDVRERLALRKQNALRRAGGRRDTIAPPPPAE